MKVRLKQDQKNWGHEIVASVLYGPVRSRRYGASLGVNLLPAARKVCNFNCIYCQLGWTEGEKNNVGNDFIPSDLILSEINRRLPEFVGEQRLTIDNIVVSGNGEPTLYPEFLTLSQGLLTAVRKYSQTIPVICFTNGTTLRDPEINRALRLYDECCVKLDADLEHIDLPQAGFDLKEMLQLMADLDNLVIQACFMEGPVANTATNQVEEWLSWMRDINPKRIDVYTISRNTPHGGLRPTSQDFLSQISQKLKDRDYHSVRVSDLL